MLEALISFISFAITLYMSDHNQIQLCIALLSIVRVTTLTYHHIII